MGSQTDIDYNYNNPTSSDIAFCRYSMGVHF